MLRIFNNKNKPIRDGKVIIYGNQVHAHQITIIIVPKDHNNTYKIKLECVYSDKRKIILLIDVLCKFWLLFNLYVSDNSTNEWYAYYDFWILRYLQ